MIDGFNAFVPDTQGDAFRRAGEPCKVAPQAFDLLIDPIQTCDCP